MEYMGRGRLSQLEGQLVGQGPLEGAKVWRGSHDQKSQKDQAISENCKKVI